MNDIEAMTLEAIQAELREPSGASVESAEHRARRQGAMGAARRAHEIWSPGNAAHMSRSCSQPDLVATGGNGLFYCFAQ